MARQVPAYSTYDFSYKTVSNLDLKITFFLPDSPSSYQRPLCLYFHAGGLFTGTRNDCLTRGYGLATAAYRMLPQISGHEVVDDIVDAYTFIYTKSNDLLPSKPIDTDRIFVAVTSAGGYCAAVRIVEYTTSHAIIKGRTRAPDYKTRYIDVFETDLVMSEVEVNNDPEGVIQQGGKIIASEEEHLGRDHPQCERRCGSGKASEVCPFFGVDKDYPPTVIIHGMHHSLVPLSQSEAFAKVLKEFGVKHLLLVAPGDNGFDLQPSEELYEKVLKKSMEFVDKVL